MQKTERKKRQNGEQTKKSSSIIPEKTSGYKNSALGKAFSKVSKNLPKGSPKKISVLAKIVQNLTPPSQVDLISQCLLAKRRKLFTEKKTKS